MSIFLSKNEKHRQQMAQEAELNAWKQKLQRLSDELIEWCKEKDLNISEYENIVEFTRERFQMNFGKLRINNLKK